MQEQLAQSYRHPRERAPSLEPHVDDSPGPSPESLERYVNVFDPGDEHSCSTHTLDCLPVLFNVGNSHSVPWTETSW